MKNNIKDFIGVIDLEKIFEELNDLKQIITNAPITKQVSYYLLDEYNKPKDDFIHRMLEKYHFKNGDVEANSIENNPYAAFWWTVYGMMDNTMYVYPYPFLHHHASTFERQKVDLFILDCIINELKNNQLNLPVLNKGENTTLFGKRIKIKYVHDYSPRGTENQLIEVTATSGKRYVFSTCDYLKEDEKIY